jgi:serine/threonine protein kinase
MAADPCRVKELFVAALDLPDPQARQAFLERECGGDADLRRRLEILLQAHDDPASALDEPLAAVGPAAAGATSSQGPADGPATASYHASAEDVGTVIVGRYKLLEPIGEGGMGTVWVAEQAQPVRRKVALKLIKAGMDSKSVLARFEAERQALALMDHPNIAKVLDGGTAAGRPFFVMEYVKGVPLTRHCDDARLRIPDRLALFVAVCQAVQHAHTKGVVHRDLKPSNILVCLYDGVPVPKVIDFGLAKALHQPLTEHTLHTAHGVLLGTPLYMSPEQAEFNNLDVDTRTDVYALGVILYELLTGTTPLERRRLHKAAWEEVLRLIKEAEPPRPSARLSGSGSLPSVAAQRQLEPVKLTRLVRGELDWIVMKALEKDRARRYETASGLALDIQRYLSNEPVEAGPPSARYRLRKFVQRNKPRVILGAVVLVTLLAGIAGTTVGLLRALASERVANDEAMHARDAERVAKERLVEVTTEKGRAERHLRLLADALAPVNKGTDESARYSLFREYLMVSYPDDTPLAFRQRIDDAEQALRDLPEDITRKVQLSRALALHHLKYAVSLGIDAQWEPALQHCDRAVEILERDCVIVSVGPGGARSILRTTSDANRMIWPALWLAYAKRADVLSSLGRFRDADADYQLALDRDTDDPALRLRYADNLFALRRYDRAAAEAEKLLAGPDTGMPMYFALDAAKSLVEKVAQLKGDAARAERFASLALRWLRRALAQGNSPQGILDMLQTDDAFAAVRARTDYRKLMRELEGRPKSE